MYDFSFTSFNKLSFFILIIFLIPLIILFPYFKSEYLTLTQEKNINSQQICKNESLPLQKNANLLYNKIVDYDKTRNSSIIYCIYDNKDYNLQLNLEKRGEFWTVIYTIRLNKESYFYYPFYI